MPNILPVGRWRTIMHAWQEEQWARGGENDTVEAGRHSLRLAGPDKYSLRLAIPAKDSLRLPRTPFAKPPTWTRGWTGHLVCFPRDLLEPGPSLLPTDPLRCSRCPVRPSSPAQPMPSLTGMGLARRMHASKNACGNVFAITRTRTPQAWAYPCTA